MKKYDLIVLKVIRFFLCLLAACIIGFVILVSFTIYASDPPQYSFNIMTMLTYLLLTSPFLILLGFGIYRISCAIGMKKIISEKSEIKTTEE